MKQQKKVIIKYLSYRANGGMIQVSQVLAKTSKEILKTIQKKSDEDMREILIEKARKWCARNNYYIDIIY